MKSFLVVQALATTAASLTASDNVGASVGLLPSLGGQSDTRMLSTSKSACKCFPGDICWPSSAEWSRFNHSINGRLVATIPLASPCHDDEFTHYNMQKCQKLQQRWLQPETHYPDSASIMAPFFANRSCDPFLPRKYRCIIGTYVQYSVNVSKFEHISRTIEFAKLKNIRLVIRNTGHDYIGKSTGAGALSIWTHHLKTIQIKQYSSKHYTGAAMKMGAGVQGFEAYAAAHAKSLAVVGGECPTVGLAGGYTQGGGHSALASRYGLAADQVLEWQVIDGTGKLYTASRYRNSDLFWALSGGGGGTYGVVVSMTSKAHTDLPTSGANLTFTNQGISQNTFYAGVSAFHSLLAPIVDSGVMSVWYFTNTSFAIAPLTGPGVPMGKLQKLMDPFINKLNQLGIPHNKTFRQFPSYLDQFKAMQAPIEVGIAQYGGRLIPRSVVIKRNSELTEAFQYINENGGQVIGVGLNVSKAVAGDVYNAVNPTWRETLIDIVITTPWNFTASLEEMEANQVKMTTKLIPKLAALTPNGSCYINEADFLQPDYKQVFYGLNYDRLLSIKNKYDPDHMFYAKTAVGSDFWEVQADGRLCQAHPST